MIQSRHVIVCAPFMHMKSKIINKFIHIWNGIAFSHRYSITNNEHIVCLPKWTSIAIKMPYPEIGMKTMFFYEYQIILVSLAFENNVVKRNLYPHCIAVECSKCSWNSFGILFNECNECNEFDEFSEFNEFQLKLHSTVLLRMGLFPTFWIIVYFFQIFHSHHAANVSHYLAIVTDWLRRNHPSVGQSTW